MPGHADILDERESIRKPFMAALGLHAAVFVTAVVWTLAGGTREPWGDPTSRGGGAVGINPVKTIPVPPRPGKLNPVANDTQSQAPAAPPKPQEAKPAPKQPEPDAVALKTKRMPKRQSDIAASRQRYRPSEPTENQVHSSTGQAAVSPMFSGAPGSAGVGVGPSSPFGNRFGAYAALMRDRVAEKWRTEGLNAQMQRMPAIVAFDILKNGQVRNVRIFQSSGNAAVDFSAQRAILDASPFPPLPVGYGRDSASVELWFELQR